MASDGALVQIPRGTGTFPLRLPAMAAACICFSVAFELKEERSKCTTGTEVLMGLKEGGVKCATGSKVLWSCSLCA